MTGRDAHHIDKEGITRLDSAGTPRRARAARCRARSVPHRGERRAGRRGWPSRSSSLAADSGITGCISSAAIAHHLQRRVEHGAEPQPGRRSASDLRSTHGSCAEKYRLAAPSISQIASSARCIAGTSKCAAHPVAAARRRAASSSRSSSVNSPGSGTDAVEVLVDHRQRPLRQVAQLVGEVGVDPADDGVLAVAAVLAERHLAQQEVAHLVDAERVDQGDRVDDVADRLAHLLAALTLMKPCAKTLRGKLDSGRHQERGPVHGVEPDDVLADHVQIGGPVPAERLAMSVSGKPTPVR